MSEKTKILLVDDNAQYLRMMSANLTSLGFVVASTANPLDAPALARQFQPDVILLDVVMPQQDGGDLYNLLRSEPAFRNTPIFFVSCMGGNPYSHEKRLGFIPKPVKLDLLVHDIRNALSAPGAKQPGQSAEKIEVSDP
ncbi:hypothetical protein LBMAG56_51590 [Verrucomicrobiota bacterium]|nr:hypothetical protein LBMAG56_51590 [Verrucomicrobiota bacterium]